MDPNDIALLRKTFENALVENDPIARLIDLGWPELFAADPRIATTELFEAQGRLLTATRALDHVVAAAMGHPIDDRTAIVHPSLEAWDVAPGCTETGAVAGLLLAGGSAAGRVVVPFEIGNVELTGLETRDVGGFDPTLHLIAVHGHVEVQSRSTAIEWVAVAAVARRALAHEICAIAESMLDRAIAHVSDRHQFGRPIASFQSVRHQLTEVRVGLASARAALDASWTAADPMLADAAKALAGHAGLTAARHCMQVTGAIGFTEEYELAAAIRRLYVLDGLYGSARQLTARIGGQLLAEGAVPRLHPLESEAVGAS